MIRTTVMITFWALAAPFAALIGFPLAYIQGHVRVLYQLFMWGARAGIWLTGVRVETVGMDKLDFSRSYLFMSNHVSNLDPPIQIPALPKQTSVMVKKELFKVPILGAAMHMGNLVPVDRGNRDAGIEAVRAAKEVVDKGMNMTIYVEGKRSFDGKLLPFKKGPFYLAMESGVPVVPITIVGTHEIWPKGVFALRPGTATVIFHEPIDPKAYPSQEELLDAVRQRIASGLPEKYQ